MFIEFEANELEANQVLDIIRYAKKHLQDNTELGGQTYTGSLFMKLGDIEEEIKESIADKRTESGSELLEEVTDLREETIEKDNEINDLENEIEDLEAQISELEKEEE